MSDDAPVRTGPDRTARPDLEEGPPLGLRGHQMIGWLLGDETNVVRRDPTPPPTAPPAPRRRVIVRGNIPTPPAATPPPTAVTPPPTASPDEGAAFARLAARLQAAGISAKASSDTVEGWRLDIAPRDVQRASALLRRWANER
jgi:hypothetical protein